MIWDLLPETLLGDRVPFEDPIDDYTVLMRDGGVMAMYLVSGVYPDTSDETDRNVWFDVIHNTILNIAADDIELTFYQVHSETDFTGSPAEHRSQFAEDLDNDYRVALQTMTIWTNRLSFTVHIRAPGAAAQATTNILSGAEKPNLREVIGRRTERLTEICQLIEARLHRTFGLRRLGTRAPRKRQLFNEIAEELVFAMTGTWRQIPATTGRMGNAMFSETIRFRWKRIEYHGPGLTTYGQAYGIREYPLQTFPGMFHPLSHTSYRSTVMNSFRVLGHTEAMDAITRKQNKALTAGDKAITQTAALTDAADELMNRQWVLGGHSFLVLAFADTKKAMAEVGTEVWRDLGACGMVATRMTSALQAGFLSFFPGGGFWRPRPGLLKSTNLVAFQPFYNWPTGREKGHWPGGPITYFRTLAGTLYAFHWHYFDNGNCLVTGTPGSGKTTGVAFLIAMTAGRARVIAIDHKEGWRFLIEQLDGDYAAPHAGAPYFAPLKALDRTPGNIAFLTILIRGCIGGKMTEEEGRRLSIGLDVIMQMPPKDRCLAEIRPFFDDLPEGAGARLEKWLWGNELGWVIDAPEDKVAFGDLSGIDVTLIMKNPRAVGPSILYLFHRIALAADGTPLLVPVDEGWKAIAEEAFRPEIENTIRTIRSKNGVMVFITQSPKDPERAGMGDILVDMCPTQLHFANPKAKRSAYDGVLTDGQYDALHDLPMGEGKLLLVQGPEAIVVQIPLHTLPDYVRILSAREEDLTAARKATEIPTTIDVEIEEEIAA